jgi:hypothetical protein
LGVVQAQKRKRRQQLLEEADGAASGAAVDEAVGWVGTPRSAGNAPKKGLTGDHTAVGGASAGRDEGSRKWFASSFLSSAIDEIRHIADKVVSKGRTALGNAEHGRSPEPRPRGRPPKVHGRAAAAAAAPHPRHAAAQRRE